MSATGHKKVTAMTLIRGFCLSALSLFVSCAHSQKNHFDAFISDYQEGRDFQIEVQDRGDPITVLAIHGGRIELHTSEIARALAGDDWNLYLFEGIMEKGNSRLHLTSHHFDERRATELAGRSQLCLSIHGFREKSQHQVCLGGRNSELRSRVFTELRQSGLIEQTIENPCGRFRGEEPGNIVNLCRQQGVQLEISSALREHLSQSPGDLEKFRAALRSAVRIQSVKDR